MTDQATKEDSPQPVPSSHSIEEVLREVNSIRAFLLKGGRARRAPSQQWLTSPVLVALSAAVFGVLGTGLGAILQGHEATTLEQRRLESVLILDALKPEADNERAKRLLFLVNSGLVEHLNKKGIEKIAQTPTNIPRYSESLDNDLFLEAGKVLVDAGANFDTPLSSLLPKEREVLVRQLQAIVENEAGAPLPPDFLATHSTNTFNELLRLVTSNQRNRVGQDSKINQ